MIITYGCYSRNKYTHQHSLQPHTHYTPSFDIHPKLPSFTWVGWVWPANRQPCYTASQCLYKADRIIPVELITDLLFQWKKNFKYTFSRLVAVLHWPKSMQLEASPQDSSDLIYTRLLQHCKPMRGVSDQTHSYASPFLFTSNNSPAFQNSVSGGMGEISPHSADVRHIADGLVGFFWPSICWSALTWWKGW